MPYAADQAAERASRAEKVLQGVKFSRPREITNPYLPLSSLKEDILEGMEGGNKFRVERRTKPDIRKTFKIGDQTIETLVFEDRAYEDGKLIEVTPAGTAPQLSRFVVGACTIWIDSI